MNLDINFLFRVITFLKIFFIGRLSIYWQVLLMSIKCLQTLWSPLHLFISSSDWECHQFCWPVLLFFPITIILFVIFSIVNIRNLFCEIYPSPARQGFICIIIHWCKDLLAILPGPGLGTDGGIGGDQRIADSWCISYFIWEIGGST